MAPQPAPSRQNGVPQQPIPRPPVPQQGIPAHFPVPNQAPTQYPIMTYPPQSGFYPGYNPYEQQQNFGMPPQWAPQHHPQNQFPGGYNARPVSPPSGTAPFQPAQQPFIPNSGFPGGSGPNAPQTPLRSSGPVLNGHQHTSSNASQTSAPSTPNFSLSSASASFTPRRSAAIKISRPDGTEFDLKKEALKVSSATASPAPTSPASTPHTPATPSSELKNAKVDTPKKPVFGLPVTVKIERPEERAARLEEEAKKERIRAQEEKEEKERKERLEKKAKEEEEKKAKDVAEKVEPANSAGEFIKVENGSVEEVVSGAPSSVPSPAPGAGLPPKPVSVVNSTNAVPAALNLAAASPSLVSEPSSASISALSSARPIEDIHAISYPGSLKSPNPQLNASAEPRKFRYDREFLMQFMNICKEKPESLPPLEEIGLEADGGSGFGSRGPRGGRSSQGPSSRTGSTGLGIGGVSRATMGSFGMGQFGSGSGSLRNSTSEQRYRASLSGRSSSQGGPGGLPSLSGLPSMGLSSSRGGESRGSQRGSKRVPQSSQPSTPIAAPIPISENAWTRKRMGGDAEGTPAYIERKVKALLNKLTEEMFDPISKQILEWANKSANETDGLTLKLVIKLIFEKATDEAHWSSMYAKLCRLLHDEISNDVSDTIDGQVISGRSLFRRYLLGRCQVDFEAGWKAREDTAVAAAAKKDEDEAKQEKAKAEDSGEDKEADLMSDEYYAAQKAKRRGLGLIQLIGELFKREIVANRVISQCLLKLLSNVNDPDEEDIESACKLLTTVGAAYDRAARENLNKAFDVLNQMMKIESLPSRIKFMIMDLNDLRKDGWKSRKNQSGVMTIAEIHEQNAKEKNAAAAAARESLSRGGSRSGNRRDGAQPGEWQSVSSNPRSISRPTDFSNIGRNISSSSVTPSFGPSSVFANRKGKAAAASGTPSPISRPSSANMFSALHDAHESESPTERRTSVDEGEAAPQRKKLNLAPRTKPLAAEDDGREEGEEAQSEEEAAGTALSEGDIKSKIDLDMKELWGDKDQGGSRNPSDVAEYFSSLPESCRPLLATRLLDDLFRISKLKDAEVVAKGWKVSLEQQAVSSEVLKQALEARMPTLDDEAIDFPNAYDAIVLLTRSLSLSDDDVSALGDKIEVDGTPRVTPKQKLEKALAKLNEQA
ncbi:hypothetical protein I308_101349 [Cryptococcus tetragattii IND107]|uniref:MIF4G domain-containing protein n=1 Tax=Cryptococcus tetragattii IND107 TaxID=1296105 RepID=A0ABR3C010_9TREE|nr:translation initiation factor 4G [Cryptococcus tetragattii IND107]